MTLGFMNDLLAVLELCLTTDVQLNIITRRLAGQQKIFNFVCIRIATVTADKCEYVVLLHWVLVGIERIVIPCLMRYIAWTAVYAGACKVAEDNIAIISDEEVVEPEVRVDNL